MKTLQEIKKDLSALKEQNFVDIAHCQSEIEKSDTKIAVARQKLLKAQEDVDAKAYNEAKDELWTAQNTKEMLVEQLNKLTQEPLMPINEYRQLVKEVHEQHKKTQRGFFTEAKSVLPKLENIREKARAEYEDCSEVLKILKVIISKDREEYTKTEIGHVDSDLLNMEPHTDKYFPLTFDRIKEIMHQGVSL
ncbi:hypothetical protein [Streptococcus cuniculi]|uniref:Uncharacterized protein n=1 Tax=Streptococcus cuniculi TaxID=1432788 RepID=A0A4Y9JD36_9STRE|nr:hypothetical protein [Streptococcus cuniculi]MBF0778343.1 hypothetical protein [Streptococcus cuniculi]TFU97834.1 hypothetical protein E4T82_06325 [Streptococcus cuniculi]